MNRIQQRCLLGSAAFHGLLLGLLLVGPAFVASKSKVPDLPPLEVLPSDFLLTDAPFSGGGSPKATPPPVVQPPVVQPAPRNDPPPPQPETRAPQAAPAPAPEPEPAPKGETPMAEPPKAKTKIKVNTELVKRGANEPAPPKPTAQEAAKEQERIERAAAEQRRALARRMQSKTRNLASTLGENLSSSTTVEMPGPGGMAYLNYRQFVKTEYEDAWFPPESVADDSATVRVSVTIRRDGKVMDDRVVSPSGIPSLDNSVEAALDRVRLSGLRPFPEGTTDAQRVFTIVFNLKTKRSTG